MSQMSLHRIMAEIKSIEAKLATLPHTAFIYQGLVDDVAVHDEHVKKSQATLDSFQSAIANLASLKAARNKANTATSVTIGGVSMTIDEALAKKAALVHKQGIIRSLQGQFTNGQRAIEAANAAIETRINQQMATMFAGTKKATDDEIKIIRQSVERSQKIKLLHADGLKERLEAMIKEVDTFTTEVDYILSEINALTVVEVVMV